MTTPSEQALMAQVASSVTAELHPVIEKMIPELYRKVRWALSTTWSNHTHPGLSTFRIDALARDTVVELVILLNRNENPI